MGSADMPSGVYGRVVTERSQAEIDAAEARRGVLCGATNGVLRSPALALDQLLSCIASRNALTIPRSVPIARSRTGSTAEGGEQYISNEAQVSSWTG